MKWSDLFVPNSGNHIDSNKYFVYFQTRATVPKTLVLYILQRNEGRYAILMSLLLVYKERIFQDAYPIPTVTNRAIRALTPWLEAK